MSKKEGSGEEEQQSESQFPTGVNDGAEVSGEVNVLGNVNILGNCNQSCNLEGGVSNSKEEGAQGTFSGAQDNAVKSTGKSKGIYYFISSDNTGRPKRKSSRVKPKGKDSSQINTSSPISENRPKKRSREEGNNRFSFDLNNNAYDEQGEKSHSISQSNREISLDQVENQEVATEQMVSIHGIEGNTREGGDVDEGSNLIVQDTYEDSAEEEIRATINIGNIVGADLVNHYGLIGKSIRREGINEVDQ
ncbi:hypothetical protein Hanom_Chr08g00722431 [Helianthus anomalus]